MPKIKKVLITEFGDESKLAIVDDDIPSPGKGEVQIAVEYTIVAGSDVNMRRGTYPFQKKAPLTPGYSVVGTVRINGQGCKRFNVGDRVACLTKYDGQAELINQPERYLVPVPEGADPKLAVALVLDWVTAYQMLHHTAHVKSGQRIFVHGLSGAVGGAFLALGRIEGAEVLGTASPAKHQALRDLGAAPFDYANKKWIANVQDLGGVDAVFDPLGYQSFDESYSILRRGGLLIGYGMNLPGLSKGRRHSVLPVILKFLCRNLLFRTGQRTTFVGLSRKSKNYIPDLALLFDWLQAKKIAVAIKMTFKLEDVKAAPGSTRGAKAWALSLSRWALGISPAILYRLLRDWRNSSLSLQLGAGRRRCSAGAPGSPPWRDRPSAFLRVCSRLSACRDDPGSQALASEGMRRSLQEPTNPVR